MTTSLVLAALLTTVAEAGEPTHRVEVQDDGRIVGRMLVDAPADVIRGTIVGMQDADASSNVIEAKLQTDGSCTSIFRRTRGLWRPLEMRTRLCPTVTGWRETLVQSDDYDAYEVEWNFAETNGRTEVEIKVLSDVDLPVPSSMIRSSAVRGVDETLSTLLRRIFTPKRAKK